MLLWRRTIPQKAAGQGATIAVQDKGITAAENRLCCGDEEVVMLAEHAKTKQNVAVREGSHQFRPARQFGNEYVKYLSSKTAALLTADQVKQVGKPSPGNCC